MNKNKWLITVLGIIFLVALVAGGYVVATKKVTSDPLVVVISGGVMHTISDLRVTYELSAPLQKLYNIQVMSAVESAKINGTTVDSSNGDIFISGKACNNMSGTIPLVAKGQSTDKTIVKTLNDGRKVLEPLTMSTMMACMDTTPATNDQTLSKVFNDIAASLQSF